MKSNQLYLDVTFRVSIRLTSKQYEQLQADDIIQINDDGTFEVTDYQALTEWVDCNRSEDDCYVEDVDISE